MFKARHKSLVTPATNLVLHLNKNWNPNKENPIDKELETHVGTYDSGYINGTDDISFDENNYETYPFAIKFGYNNDTTSHTDVFFRSNGKYEVYYYGIKSKPRVCAYIDTSTSPCSIKFTDTNSSSEYGEVDCTFYQEAKFVYDGVENNNWYDQGRQSYFPSYTTETVGDIHIYINTSLMPVFYNKEDADEYMTTGDYSKALNVKNSDENIYVVDELIPRMTSDTTPKGICSASTVMNGRYAYYGFTMSKGEININNAQHFWYNNGGADQWIGYEFESPATLYRVSFRAYENATGKRFRFQFSLDGTNWTNGNIITITSNDYTEYNLENPVYCKHLRIYCIDNITVINSITAWGYYGEVVTNSKIQQGTFITAGTTHGTVEVPLDFDADYILVTLPFSETNLTYAIYDKNRMVMNRKMTYWLIPSENNNYQINMVETNPTGETGITWKTANSFTFHSNGGNTQNVECTFIAYKF